MCNVYRLSVMSEVVPGSEVPELPFTIRTGPANALAAGRGERDPGTGARSCPGFHLPLSNEAALVPADDRWVARRQPMKTQSTTATDCRCKACGALLAKRDRDGLTDQPATVHRETLTPC